MNVEKCRDCRHLGDYTRGPYWRHPHYCCELIWTLYEEDYKVDPEKIDAKCPLKNENLVNAIGDADVNHGE